MVSIQLDLPLGLKVDASDAKRRGIRISLDTLAIEAARQAQSVDCAGMLQDDETPLRELQYAIVDVETTGGGWSRGHRITEIAAVRVRGDGSVVDEFRTLVNPERPIPYFITALTSITGEMVRGAPKFADIAPDVARVLRGAIFVAHNAGFDWNFVGAEMERAGVPLTGSTLCTVRLARRVVPELRSRSLDSLTGFFNIPIEARHRAYGDAYATTELFRRLMTRLDELEVTNWHELQTLLRRRAKKRKRIANPHSMTEPFE